MRKHNVTLAAIISITVLEGIALICGINGVMLAGAIGIVAGLGGFITGKEIEYRRE